MGKPSYFARRAAILKALTARGNRKPRTARYVARATGLAFSTAKLWLEQMLDDGLLGSEMMREGERVPLSRGYYPTEG